MRYIFKIKFDELAKIQKGRTDTEFMASIDMDASTLSRIKAGQAHPSRDFIANVLGNYPKAKLHRLFYLAPAVTRIKAKGGTQ